MAKKKDKRRHKRFQSPKGLFVGIGPDNTTVGRVSDLSIGGLAFCYVGIEEPSSGSYLDLFFTDEDFYLGRLQFKTVSDCELVEKEPSSSETLRRCGVKFRRQTRHQKAAIKRFIQDYTMGEA